MIELEFDDDKLPRMCARLLLDLVASQQAMAEAIAPHLGSAGEEFLADYKALYPVKRDALLDLLYGDFGSTPELGLPSDPEDSEPEDDA